MFQWNPCMASKTTNQQEEKFRDSTFHGFSGVYRTIYVHHHRSYKILAWTNISTTTQHSSRPKTYSAQLKLHEVRSTVDISQLAFTNRHTKVSTSVIAAQVLPVSLSMPVLDTIKLLTVDDLVPKELVNQPKNQAKYKTRSKPSLKEKDSGISQSYLIVSNICFFPLVLNPFWIVLPLCCMYEPLELLNW